MNIFADFDVILLILSPYLTEFRKILVSNNTKDEWENEAVYTVNETVNVCIYAITQTFVYLQ